MRKCPAKGTASTVRRLEFVINQEGHCIMKFGIVQIINNPLLWKRLYTNYVRSHLEYAEAVWMPYAKKDKRILEKIQRRATLVTKSLEGRANNGMHGKVPGTRKVNSRLNDHGLLAEQRPFFRKIKSPWTLN